MKIIKKTFLAIKKYILLKRLSSYPFSFECFSTYVEWLLDNVKEGLDQFSLISILDRKDRRRLSELEESVKKSCHILSLETGMFARKFGFLDDLLVDDNQKIHDLLAEPLFALSLDEQGFSKIQKLPNKIKADGSQLASADFIATRNSRVFAIEVKTVRTETGLVDGEPFGDPLQDNWWGKMFFNNAVMKIEDKSQRVIRQLENTQNTFNCDVTMLALVSRRLGPSTLLSESEHLQELEKLKNQYPNVDFFCGKLYYGEIAFYPELD